MNQRRGGSRSSCAATARTELWFICSAPECQCARAWRDEMSFVSDYYCEVRKFRRFGLCKKCAFVESGLELEAKDWDREECAFEFEQSGFLEECWLFVPLRV